MKLYLIAVIVNIFALGIVQGTKAVTNLEQLQQLGLEGRIIGGKPAVLGQFPWQALISSPSVSNYFYCGGALISEHWVLTSAYCVKQATVFKVRLGSIYYNGNYEHTQEINSGLTIHHPEYNPHNYHNNIGLIKLSRRVWINKYVQPIKLASQFTPPGTNLTVSGFGAQSTGGYINTVLYHVSVLSITNQKCEEAYGGSFMPDSVICTLGMGVEGICTSDEGGPLIHYHHEHPIHVGVVSFRSSAGCEKGHPSGYTRTASFRTWIHHITGV